MGKAAPDAGFRIDMPARQCEMVEVKAVAATNPICVAQLRRYLRFIGARLGYLIDFNVSHIEQGIKRMVV